jgi:hypothetical protein
MQLSSQGFSWETSKFPNELTDLTANWQGRGHKMAKPHCWTPIHNFWFGGKFFTANNPCIAFETSNFGWIIQRRHDTIITARE